MLLGTNQNEKAIFQTYEDKKKNVSQILTPNGNQNTFNLNSTKNKNHYIPISSESMRSSIESQSIKNIRSSKH